MKRITAILLIIALAHVQGYAQSAALGFVHTASSQANVLTDDTLKIDTYIRNYGNVPFNDSLHFGLSHDGVMVNDPAIFPRPFFGGNPTIHINPGDSFPIHFKIVIKPTEFLAGPTGVVIWPITINQNAIVRDSLTQQLTVSLRTGVEERLAGANTLQYIMDNHSLRIVGTDVMPSYQGISLYNAVGQLLFQTTDALPITIPLDRTVAGIILVQIRLKDEGQLVKKIFLSNY